MTGTESGSMGRFYYFTNQLLVLAISKCQDMGGGGGEERNVQRSEVRI